MSIAMIAEKLKDKLKTITLVCVFLFGFVSVANAYTAQSGYNPYDLSLGTRTSRNIEIDIPKSLNIKSGNGEIIIYYDGRVELKNTSLDEAAKEFWNQISVAFPEFKKHIIREIVVGK